MANHTQAAQALLFMQQCRHHATRSPPSRFGTYHVRTLTNNSLDPENFGKKLRIDDVSPDEPLPVWRVPKPEANQATSSGAAASPMPYDFPRARDAPIPRHKHNPAVKSGLWSFIKYDIFRRPEPPDPRLAIKPAFNVLTNPYRTRKAWPPILSEMSEIQQFHYEKKFRRRLLNKTYSLRTNWNRGALFIQRFLITFFVLWSVFVESPRNPLETLGPIDSFRYWLYTQLTKGNDTIWPKRFGAFFESQRHFYMQKHKIQWDPFNHTGWDPRRPRNSLAGPASPAFERPLGDSSSTSSPEE